MIRLVSSLVDRSIALVSLTVISMCTIIVSPQGAEAQTFALLHSFTGAADGGYPAAGLTLDRAGNLYGTTFDGSGIGYGKIFKLSHPNGGWVFTPLYSFSGGTDGANPIARVVFGPDGSLYGTTFAGGGAGCESENSVGCGTVFNLKPPPTRPRSVFEPWNETVLFRFTGGVDGGSPGNGDLIFDKPGAIYGTTSLGGLYGSCNGYACGTVFKMTRSNGSWQESVLYNFGQGSDGQYPGGGLIFDNAGNLYGTTEQGGTANDGTVYQLTPSGSGWTEGILHNFDSTNDGGWGPQSGLIFDPSGNLYGVAALGGSSSGGTAFELAPSGGGWTFNVLYGFSEVGCCVGPTRTLVMDASGGLYGTTWGGGVNGLGAVFKLTLSNGIWIYTSLHDFTGGTDGQNPASSLILDGNGNLYGTAVGGGAKGYGVVFEIMP